MQTTIARLGLGLALVVLALAAHLGGAFTGWERRTIDELFRRAPREPRPMSSEIVHVDIDDGALDLVGRWPWPRSVLAGAVEELKRAGARTVALDLLLSEASDEGPVDHDGALGASLDGIEGVLALEIHSGSHFDDAWRTPEGREELSALLEELGQDVQLTYDEVLEKVELTGPRPNLYRGRPLLFKRAAIWRRTFRDSDPPETYEELRSRLAPRLGDYTGTFPQEPLIQSVWNQYRSWRHCQSGLATGTSAGTFLDRAPVAALSKHASGVGFVNVDDEKHEDGTVREMTVLHSTWGGTALQFGLAAAVRHLGLDPSDVQVEDDRVRIGDRDLPLHRHRLWIAWPTTSADPPWSGLLCQSEDDPAFTGHLSIRELVALHRARETQRTNRRKLDEVSRLILAYIGTEFVADEELTEAHLEEIAEEIEFTLADAPEGDPEDEDAAFLDHVHNCRAWNATRGALAEGEKHLDLVGATLRRKVEEKLVFVGWTATGALADFLATAVGPRTPGVVVHAAVADMVLSGEGVHFLPGVLTSLLIIVIGALGTLAAMPQSILRSTFLVIALLVGYLALGLTLFSQGWIIPFVAPLVAGSGTWIGGTALQVALARADRQRLVRQFSARVSQQLVDHLVENPDALTVGGEEREVSVMFCDLAGFTSLSEALGGPGTVKMVNLYMRAMTQVLTEEDAYVNKFLGDGLMAFWSPFTHDLDQATKACRAAVGCQEAVHRLNADPRTEGVPPLGLRIGVATGRVIVGDCGAPPELHDFTVIGDAVNLSARLESANKQFGTKMMMNGPTKEQLDDTQVLTRPLGRIIVVGQSVPVEIHEILPPDYPLEIVRLTREAVEAFTLGDFTTSLNAFSALREEAGENKLADIYEQAIAEVEDDFDGVLRLRAK